MVPPSPHFIRIVLPLRAIERRRGPRAVQAFLASDAFAQNVVKLSPEDRIRVFNIVAETMGAPVRVLRDPRFPPPRRCIKWDELTKARFRKAWLQGGPHAGAKAVGVSYRAAVIAARRQGLPSHIKQPGVETLRAA